MKCKICGYQTNVIFKQQTGFAVSSLGKIIEASAETFLCDNCAHCQTQPSIDLFEYYSKHYKTLSFSVEEDDLYAYENGKPVYRNYFQAITLIKKLKDICEIDAEKVQILDFGCGKSMVMKHLMNLVSNKNIYLYDVSKDYVKFWETFLPNNHYSCFNLPANWENTFEVITSFFSFEHVSEPLEELVKMNQLLKNDGFAYIIVPNMYSENIADMLVIDHVHHYSEPSMALLFEMGGFEMLHADHITHVQGSIYIARKCAVKNRSSSPIITGTLLNQCSSIAQFWKSFNNSLKNFENQMINSGIKNFYIIGAGFIGTYIYLQLNRKDMLVGFIDSNTHKQKKGWQGKNVLAPGTIQNNNDIAILSGFNAVQIENILPGLLPIGIHDSHVWSLKKIVPDDF